ncbi:MAG TPA: aldehyde dehydrogenase [Novosphingobium sp.]|nr:aldehyde dehydrogenase [Novosphingobium sp.]
MILEAFNAASELSEDVRTRFFIDGEWREPTGSERFELISPMTEELTLSVPAGADADMHAAVAAARRAFDEGEWPRLSPTERARYMLRIADELDKRTPLLKRVWTAQVGAPQFFVELSTSMAAEQFRYYAGMAESYPFEEDRDALQGRVSILREPVGVSALIIPWNTPLVLLTGKAAPAMLAGCTMVVKPSPETPLDALILAECVAAAGVPAGVFNVVPAGREVGNTLISDARVDKVSFTGSTDAGRHIAKVCADRVARVSLELGGKSASILCEDADIDAWMDHVALLTMPFSGQICFSQTRVLVPESRHDEFLDAYVAKVESFKVGDPWDPDVLVGPLSIARQRQRVLDYIDLGRKEGARVVIGGGKVAGFNRGYYVEPTIFDGVDNSMRIAREEIFGPVVSVIGYRTDEEAIAIANDSDYGLSGSVFSGDMERGKRIARRVRTGHIGVNTFAVDYTAPFGGYKKSGLGREAGVEGLAGFLETKSMFVPG